MCRNYLQHVLLAVWRRKSGALACLMVFTVLILLLQYHNVQQRHVEPHDAGIQAPLRVPAAPQRTLRMLADAQANATADRDRADQPVAPDAGRLIPPRGVGRDERRVPVPGRYSPDGAVADSPNQPANTGSEIDRLGDRRPFAGSANDLGARQPPVHWSGNADQRNVPAYKAPGDPGADVAVGDQGRVMGGQAAAPVNGLSGANSDPALNKILADRIAGERSKKNYEIGVLAAQGQVPVAGNWAPVGGNEQQPIRVEGRQLDPSLGIYNGANQPPYIPKLRLFHLDLKGAPPKLGYLKKLFPLLKQFGTNGILLEYEDMFPFDGELASTAAKNHYTRDEVRQILAMAREQQFEVIPLVQTFGHVEFILKHRDFGSLREVSNVPQAFCPSNNDSMPLIEELIDQVMALHPGVRWLHVGCDEVFQLGVCPRCMSRSMTQGRDALFLSHVARVAEYVRRRHNVIPIIWDDMLHHFTTESLKQFELGKLVEPMVWTYVQDVYRFVPHDVWAMYGEVFPYVWAASAFKGAFGETLVVPPVKRHLENNLAWLDVMAREETRFKEFRGIAVTGWQRYDHFATLAELLPAAIPSLAVSMLAVSHGYFNESLMRQMYDGLQCMKSVKYTTFVDLERDPYLWDKMQWCFFPGVTFFKVTERLDTVSKAVAEYLLDETVKKAWLTEYNVRHNFSSVSRIDASLANFPFHYPDVETLIRHARDTLREVYDEYTVAEWIEQKVYPLLRKLDLLRQTAESLKKAVVWPARPFDPLPELQKYGIGIPTDNPPRLD